ncbi:InlB B-repeat-containing protein [Butyrivibrio sp. XPD2002]|uniref:InlB B-repeat-containing protein n=1 Tax=Butyrivibrio sp. XPD2002 TaxID=1280665 RepID=UPI000478F97A|nr:InlB B-repeat-containing protein [Butyrivibrio sp. XPD2002]
MSDALLKTTDLRAAFNNTPWILSKIGPIKGSIGNAMFDLDADGNMIISGQGEFTYEEDDINDYAKVVKSLTFKGDFSKIDLTTLSFINSNVVSICNESHATIKLPRTYGLEEYSWCDEEDITEPITYLEEGHTAKKIYEKLQEHFTILFDGNGATSGNMDPIKGNVGTSINLPTNQFKKDGYTFAYWQVISNGQYDDLTCNDGASVYVGRLDNNRFTLKAVWIKLATVSFNSNGGSGSMSDLKLGEGESIKLPENGFRAPYGKEFDAWKINGTIYKVGDAVTINSSTVAYAVWVDKPSTGYSVFFYANGGSGSMASIKVIGGETVTLPDNRFSAPEGMEFDSWDIEGTNYEPGKVLTIDKPTYVYAVWRELPKPEVSVSFYANGGSGTMISAKVRKGNDYILPMNSFAAPKGKEFDHWDINSFDYYPGDKISVTGKTNVYAVWKDIPGYIPEPEKPNEDKGAESKKEETAKQESTSAKVNEEKLENTGGLSTNEEIDLSSGIKVKASSDASTVSIKSIKNKKSISIPAKVTAKEKEYPVTELGKKAITGKKVKKITIDATNLKKVDKNAFKGAKNLQKVTIKGVKKGTKIAKQIEKAAKKANKNVKIVYK